MFWHRVLGNGYTSVYNAKRLFVAMNYLTASGKVSLTQLVLLPPTAGNVPVFT